MAEPAALLAQPLRGKALASPAESPSKASLRELTLQLGRDHKSLSEGELMEIWKGLLSRFSFIESEAV